MGFTFTVFVLCALVVGAAMVYQAWNEQKLPIIIGGSVEPGFEDVLKTFR